VTKLVSGASQNTFPTIIS